MTTIISRLFDSPDTAAKAADALRKAGHDPDTIATVTVTGDAAAAPGDAAARAEAIAAAGVGHVSAAAYARAMGPGQALLVVRAPFTPFGRARSAMRIADSFGPLAVPGTNPDQHVPDQPRPRIFYPAIGRHAHVLTPDMPPRIERRRGLVSAAFGVPLLLRRRRRRAGMPSGWRVTGWLMPLLSRRRPRKALLQSGSFLSRMFWPLPLLSRRTS